MLPELYLYLAVASSPAVQQGQTSTAVVNDPGPATASNRIVYPATFFRAFQPQTALDMLARTPGFTLQGGGDDLVRGFGGNAGNVLIDGQRPTVKAGGVEAVLARIAALRVERIELIRGADTAEAQGRTLIANVVLKADAGGSGNGSFELRRAPDDEFTPRVDVNYSRKLGDWQTSAGIVAFYENNPIGGRYELSNASGAPLSSSAERFDQTTRGAIFTASASRPLGGGTLSVNARLNYEREAYTQVLNPISGLTNASRIDGLDTDWDAEIGGDWTRGVGHDWIMKLVGLGRTERSDFSEDAASDDALSAFAQRNHTIETVVRGTIARQGNHAIRPEFGGEVAYNRLTSRLTYAEGGLPLALPGANTRVSEVRGEAFANLTIRVRPRVRLEAGLALEASRITVSGDSATARTLSFWKPSAAIVWDMTGKTQARVGVRRTVGQLDFTGFAATGNLVDDRPIAGNAELRPETTTAWSGTVDHRFGEGGAFSLTLSWETINDALTYVPLASGGETLLNFGIVRLWRLSGEATLPLGAVIKGARLTVTGSMVSATRPDPVTGLTRRDYRDYDKLEVAFRHDLERLRSAYGINVSATASERAWFISEFQKERARPYVSAYIETAIIPGVKTTLNVSGISGEREYRSRQFFTPDRAGTFTGTERRTRSRGTYVALLFARQF